MDDKNYLLGVKCLYNTDTYTVIELDTKHCKKIIRLPYTRVVNLQGDKYEYSMSVKNYCKAMGIDYRKYFQMIHKDCE